MDKDIIHGCVHSTQKWLYHYILDIMNEEDPNYKMIESAVKDIYEFQETIREELLK